MNETGSNLAMIVGAWTEMMRSGSTESLAAILDEQVIWQGVTQEYVCRNREEVLDILVRNRPGPPRLTKMEASESGDRVAISVDGPDFHDTADLRAGPRSLVFTFREGRVVRMESTPTRDAAFELVQS